MTAGDALWALKPLFVLAYGAFGLFCLVMALRSRAGRPVPAAGGRRWRIVAVLLPAVAAIVPLEVLAGAGSLPLLAATAIGTGVFAVRHAAWKAPLTLLPAAATVALVLTLAWWEIFAPGAVMLLALAGFAVVLAGLVVGFADPWNRPSRGVAPDPTKGLCPLEPRQGLGPWNPLHGVHYPAVICTAGLLLLADLGAYRPGEAIEPTLAHHWGAFIGPALHLRAGLVPFHDIPLQYGLGPTLAIAAACQGSDCWTGTQAIVTVMDLATALLVLRMALATTMPRRPAWQCAATIAVFAACFLWPGSPYEGNSLLATPSTGGIRFLPVTLVACLLFFGRPAAATAALVPAVLWAPESAAMALVVFGLCETARIGLPRAALRGAGVLAGSCAGLVLLHRAVFGVWMEPAVFAEYVLHVPGPLPVNPFSDTLLLVAVLALGGWLLVHRADDPVTARRDRTAVFLLFATTSYWLGRSHPNNVCNLMPFLVLVALRALDRPPGQCARLADVTALGIAASVAALAMSPWRSVPYALPAIVDIHAVVADFAALEPGIERIRRQLDNPGGLGIAGFGQTYTRHPAETVVWTPMDPASLWSYVPADRRRLYIRRAAARLGRSGWAIFDDDRRFFAADFLAGYKVARQRDFAAPLADGSPGHYVALCFDPRPDTVASPVGPPCPALPHE